MKPRQTFKYFLKQNELFPLKHTAALILLWVEIFLTDLQPLECDKLSRTLE